MTTIKSTLWSADMPSQGSWLCRPYSGNSIQIFPVIKMRSEVEEVGLTWVRHFCFTSMLRISNALPRLKFIRNEPLVAVFQCLAIQHYPCNLPFSKLNKKNVKEQFKHSSNQCNGQICLQRWWVPMSHYMIIQTVWNLTSSCNFRQLGTWLCVPEKVTILCYIGALIMSPGLLQLCSSLYLKLVSPCLVWNAAGFTSCKIQFV